MYRLLTNSTGTTHPADFGAYHGFYAQHQYGQVARRSDVPDLIHESLQHNVQSQKRKIIELNKFPILNFIKIWIFEKKNEKYYLNNIFSKQQIEQEVESGHHSRGGNTLTNGIIPVSGKRTPWAASTRHLYALSINSVASATMGISVDGPTARRSCARTWWVREKEKIDIIGRKKK